ncbi:UDP-3-O-(3-hydroxymyristoyl)glucosamine N-acyltransferase [Thermodesulfobacteriota bacterium]
MPKRTLEELAVLVGGEVCGDGSVSVSRVAGIDEAGPGDITFLANPKYATALSTTGADAVIVAPDVTCPGKALLRVENPYLAFAKITGHLHCASGEPCGVADEAFVGDNVQIGIDPSIHPLAYIGKGVRIGDRVRIYPGAYVGDEVVIGDDCLLYPNVSIREGTVLGDRVIIHCGTVIGADGYGYARDGERHFKIPQVGIVRIGSDVEIGANCCVDRGTLGETVIEDGVKIDNLVQVAHNVRVGRNSILVAQVGISGSTSLGAGVVLGGQVGVVGHVKVGNGVMVGAKSGVSGDIADGSIASGYPAIPHRDWLKASAAFARLPEMRRTIRELQKEIRTLKGQRDGSED